MTPRLSSSAVLPAVSSCCSPRTSGPRAVSSSLSIASNPGVPKLARLRVRRGTECPLAKAARISASSSCLSGLQRRVVGVPFGDDQPQTRALRVIPFHQNMWSTAQQRVTGAVTVRFASSSGPSRAGEKSCNSISADSYAYVGSASNGRSAIQISNRHPFIGRMNYSPSRARRTLPSLWHGSTAGAKALAAGSRHGTPDAGIEPTRYALKRE